MFEAPKTMTGHRGRSANLGAPHVVVSAAPGEQKKGQLQTKRGDYVANKWPQTLKKRRKMMRNDETGNIMKDDERMMKKYGNNMKHDEQL